MTIRPGQQILAAALPMPVDGLTILADAIDRIYGTGDTMLDMSSSDFIRITAPKDGFGPVKRSRMPKSASEEGTIRDFEANGETLTLTLEESQDVVLGITAGLRGWFELSGATNYVTCQILTEDQTASEFHVTVQKTANPTAHDLRGIAEDRIERLEQQIRELGKEPVE